MFTIDSNGVIRLSRGDSCNFPVFLNQGTKVKPIRYHFNYNDQLHFYIVPINSPFEQFVLHRQFSYEDLNEKGDPVVTFRTNDTINLVEGEYRYVIRLQMNEGN